MITALIFLLMPILIIGWMIIFTVDSVNLGFRRYIQGKPIILLEQYSRDKKAWISYRNGQYFAHPYPCHPNIGEERLDGLDDSRIREWVTAKPEPREPKIKDMVK